MLQRTPRSTRTDTLFPAATPVRAAAEDGACDEGVELLSRICGRAIDAAALVPNTGCDDVADIGLKTYPAQYALQPLIAAASAFHRRNARQLSEISQIVVRVSTRTAERTADQIGRAHV